MGVEGEMKTKGFGVVTIYLILGLVAFSTGLISLVLLAMFAFYKADMNILVIISLLVMASFGSSGMWFGHALEKYWMVSHG